jgi:hypothetical protein
MNAEMKFCTGEGSPAHMAQREDIKRRIVPTTQMMNTSREGGVLKK